MKSLTLLCIAAVTLFFQGCASGPGGNEGMRASVSASDITALSQRALDSLYSKNAKARRLGPGAASIVVFPEVIKAGYMGGGLFGYGNLFQNGKPTDEYFSIGAVSYGLQAGFQKFGLALMLMDGEAVTKLHRSGGWNLGSAPHIVIFNKGIARSLSIQTLQKGTYAFFFDQKGLMAGLGIEGSKVTRIYPTRP